MTGACFSRIRLTLCLLILGCSTLAVANEATDQLPIAKKMGDDVRVGNSSIWIAKSQYEKLINEGILPSGILDVTFRGPITKSDVTIFQRLLGPYLDKNYFKNNPKPKWYKPNPSDLGYSVIIDSDGGDVYAAMSIGRNVSMTLRHPAS